MEHTGAGLPQALVERLSLDRKNRLDATLADGRGAFSLKAVQAGSYILKVSKPGFDLLVVHVNVSEKAKDELKLALSVSN